MYLILYSVHQGIVSFGVCIAASALLCALMLDSSYRLY